MARKSCIHYPGAFYHVILRGNGGQEIFYSKADRSRFYLLLQESIERNGHLFQGRYKAILIDADSYLLELVRYIHNNPLRTGQVNKPEQYQWSSHRAYLDKETVTWLTTDFVLSQFAKNEKKARQQFQAFCLKGGNEERREEFHQGTFDGRILGDDGFSENVLAMAKERFHAPVSVEQLVKVVCKVYRMNEQAIVSPGKHQPGAEARAVVAYFAQKAGKPSLTELGKYFQRDPTALSRVAGRLRERLKNDRALTARLKKVKSSLKRKSECQA